jgi:inner membrane protein involved in colicin E2 resistance
MNTLRENLSIYKMAWIKAGLVGVITGFTTLQTSLNGITWEVLNGTQKVLLVGGVVVAVASSLVAFLDKTISRIENEQKALNNTVPQPTVSTVTTKTTP